MSFDIIETSEYFEPVELYEFSRGIFSWYYTSSDTAVDYGGNIYLAEPIERSRIVSTQDIGKTTLKVKVSRRNVFAKQFIEHSPTDVIFLTITRIHASDNDPAVTFKGRIINVEFAENEAILTCQPNQSSLRRPGLRKAYQTTCPHVLYGAQCNVLKSSFDVVAVLTGVSGLVLSSSSFGININPAFDATWFSGGVVEFNQAGLINKRFITDHNNAAGTITLNLPLSGAVVGSTVTAYPGCNHTPETCLGKFTNTVNYGGFPYIPVKNPMDGTSIF